MQTEGNSAPCGKDIVSTDSRNALGEKEYSEDEICHRVQEDTKPDSIRCLWSRSSREESFDKQQNGQFGEEVGWITENLQNDENLVGVSLCLRRSFGNNTYYANLWFCEGDETNVPTMRTEGFVVKD